MNANPNYKLDKAKLLYCVGLYYEARAELKSINPESITPDSELKIKTMHTVLDIAIAADKTS